MTWIFPSEDKMTDQEQLVSEANDLIQRLNCRYAIGPIMENGEPEFGWRDESGPAPTGLVLPLPIETEAAKFIERLLSLLPKEGEVVVPVESTQAMVDKGAELCAHGLEVYRLRAIYKAMIEARPK